MPVFLFSLVKILFKKILPSCHGTLSQATHLSLSQANTVHFPGFPVLSEKQWWACSGLLRIALGELSAHTLRCSSLPKGLLGTFQVTQKPSGHEARRHQEACVLLDGSLLATACVLAVAASCTGLAVPAQHLPVGVLGHPLDLDGRMGQATSSSRWTWGLPELSLTRGSRMGAASWDSRSSTFSGRRFRNTR